MASARCSLTKEEIVESIVEDRRRLLKKRLREHGIRHGTINSAFPQSPNISGSSTPRATDTPRATIVSRGTTPRSARSVRSLDRESRSVNAAKQRSATSTTRLDSMRSSVATEPIPVSKAQQRVTTNGRPSSARPDGSTRHSGAERPSSARVSCARTMDLGDRAALWGLQYRKGLELRQRLKKEKEQVEIAECTFRPQIRRTMSSPFRPEAQKEHAERLHHEADLKNKMREKAKKLLELEQLASCPFTPKTCARSTSSPAPFFQRVDDGIKKQQQKVLQKQMEEELKHDFTFTPAISSRSEQIVQRKRSEAMRGMEDADILEPVENRLYNLQYRESRKVDQDNCPASGGAAHLAPKSEEIIKTSVYFQGPYKNFLHRQRAFQDAKEQRRECRLQNETPACPKEPIECIEGRMRRMGPEEHKQRMEKRRLKDVMWFEEECPFAPEINTNFRALGSEQHVFTRLNHKKETKHEPVEEPCSFQPAVDLSGRYAHVAAHYGRNVVSSQIKHDQHVRERKLDRIRVEESEKQTKDCTFHPTCGASPRNVQQPKIVNGLERFLELQKLARQQREERESTGSKSVDGYMGLTIPQPFRLSQNRKCRRSDIVEEDVKRNWDECTFRPDTIERQKRNLLRKILVSG